jgi:hypothetical protein
MADSALSTVVGCKLIRPELSQSAVKSMTDVAIMVGKKSRLLRTDVENPSLTERLLVYSMPGIMVGLGIYCELRIRSRRSSRLRY